MDDLLSLTSLPNWHPALVHFPIALLPLALLFDVASLFGGRRGRGRKRRQPLAPLALSATILYLLGAVGGFLALRTGEAAAEPFETTPRLEGPIAEHDDWGHYTAFLLGGLALLRLGLYLWERRGPRPVARLLLVAIAVGGCLLLARTADLGGALVYRYGVGVALDAGGRDLAVPPPGVAVDPSHATALTRQRMTPEGTLLWQPLAGDGVALGELLDATAPAGGSGTVTWSGSDDGRRGLPLRVDGRCLLLLPRTFEDARVEALIELQAYDGSIGLAQRSTEEGRRALLFTVSTGAEARLTAGVGESDVLDRAAVRLPSAPFRLTLTARGRQLEGSVNGTTLTRGRAPAPGVGSSGIYFDGQGTLRLLEVRVVPLG